MEIQYLREQVIEYYIYKYVYSFMPKGDVNSTNSKGPRLRNSYGIEDLGGTCKFVRSWNFSLFKTL